MRTFSAIADLGTLATREHRHTVCLEIVLVGLRRDWDAPVNAKVTEAIPWTTLAAQRHAKCIVQLSKLVSQITDDVP